ncbi:hypothetical protein DXA10_10010 [Firmicutes bacterium AM55-24TS]|jgi:hypothetical protein|nr:hypothetical protein DXA10_10010 [Firmicutes bacterium AM55-24TS]RHP11385.1 hypothetical protein DW004_01400 [Firmicutes bacterium AF36-3BH]
MKLRKIVTMGMATLMAVSAMSLSAFACENPEDAIISVLAPDGENRLYLSQEDIDNGITTVTGYQGIEVTVNPDNKIEIFNSTVTPRILSSTYFKGTNIPTSSKSIEDGSYSGTFSVPAKSQRFSTYLMLNRSNTKVLMEVEPNTNFNKKVEFSLCSKEVSTSPLITIEPNANDQAISVSGIAKNSHLYAYIDNNLSSVAEGTLSFIGY